MSKKPRKGKPEKAGIRTASQESNDKLIPHMRCCLWYSVLLIKAMPQCMPPKNEIQRDAIPRQPTTKELLKR